MVNRRIPLSEAVDFCTRSSDEDTDNDEAFSDQEDSAANQTVYGGQTEMLPENENEDLTSDNEQSEIDEMETAENSDRQFHRRKNKYLVCSIDTSLDENNYDMIDIANVEEKEIDVSLERKGKQVTKKITWTTKKPTQNICQDPQNIVPNRHGVKPEYHRKVESLEAWSTFIDDDIIQLIVTPTSLSMKAFVDRSKIRKVKKFAT